MSNSALDKGLRILEEIAETPAGVTAQEMAERIGIHKTNVYHYLNALESRRYIRRDVAGRFHLAHRVLELGAHLLQQIPLRDAAHEHLLRLSRQTAKTIHLCVLEECEVLYIDKIEGPHTLPMRSRVGTRVPAHCTASGKVLLAYLPAVERERIVEGMVLERRTPATIVDRREFEATLREAFESGYAVDHGENEEHICCFAAPIFDQSGRAAAAISLTGLSSELLEPEEHARVRQLVLTTADRISAERGYVRSSGAGQGLRPGPLRLSENAKEE